MKKIINESLEEFINERDIFINKHDVFDGQYGSYEIDDFDVRIMLDWEELDDNYNKAKKMAKAGQIISNRNYEPIRNMILDDLMEEDDDITDIKWLRYHSNKSSEELGIAFTAKIYSEDEEGAGLRDFKSFGSDQKRKNHSHKDLF